MGLPVQLSTFVGRASERGAVAELIGSARLVTLGGPGGCGKTRLAVEVASQAAKDPDVVLFVDLSPVDDQAAVARVLADATGTRSSAVEGRRGDHRRVPAPISAPASARSGCGARRCPRDDRGMRRRR